LPQGNVQFIFISNSGRLYGCHKDRFISIVKMCVIYMEYRILGRTGLKVSAVGFGGIPIGDIPEAEARQVICKAFDEGINFFHWSFWMPRGRALWGT
jgi:hypothetical protein